MPIVFERATAEEIQALPRDTTVFFFPVGALEDHGPHLPVGADLDEASRLCWLTAERLERDLAGWRAVVMPRAPIGVDTATTRCALPIRGHVLRDWLVDCCFGLHRLSFRHFVCFTGTIGPRQLTAIEEAGKILRKRTGGSRLRRWLKIKAPAPVLVSANSALVSPIDVRRAPLWPDPQEHGGSRDTSVALALDAAAVRAVYSGLIDQTRPASIWERLRRRLRREAAGYWGNPSAASAEAGARVLDEQVNDVYPKLRAVWSGSSPDHLFRSWYSILPSNGSFFKAWALALTLMLLLTLWFFISFGYQIPD